MESGQGNDNEMSGKVFNIYVDIVSFFTVYFEKLSPNFETGYVSLHLVGIQRLYVDLTRAPTGYRADIPRRFFSDSEK